MQVRPAVSMDKFKRNCECYNRLTNLYRLYYPFSLASFYNCINTKIKEHEARCPNRLQFFMEPKSEFRVFSLHGMCSVCDNLVTIVD